MKKNQMLIVFGTTVKYSCKQQVKAGSKSQVIFAAY